MRLSILFLFSLLATLLHAQQFGAFPPNTKWKMLDTDTVRVIFEPQASGAAQRVASMVHAMAAAGNRFPGPLKKVNIVLHGNTTLANGYVSLGPFRSEFYLVPGGNIFEFGNLPWTDQLAIHEYRHVQQYNYFDRGISHAAGILFGQEGRALANAIAIPDWFFEGDAVYAETALTPQGRGRTAWFLNSYKALWKEGRNYSWMKLRNGSLKDMVPNHYPLGYLLVNYGYLKYGSDFWLKVTRDASAFRGLLHPFPSAIRRYSGLRFKAFRKEAYKYYSHEVSRSRDERRKRETVVNEYFPKPAGKDSLVFLRDSYRSLPAIYVRDGNGDHRIRLRNISTEDWLSHEGNTIAYTMYATHPRWSLRDYSDIVLLDMATKKETRITHHKKYFTPALSPYDSTLVAVNMNDSLQSELHFLDRSGNLLQSRKAPAGGQFVHPAFLDRNHLVVAIRQHNAKMTLHRLDLQTMKFEQILPPTFATIGFFEVHNGIIYFSASLSGQDQVYALNPEDRSTYPVSSGGIGHYFPSVRDSLLYSSGFTGNGFRIEKWRLDTARQDKMNISQWFEAQSPFPVAGADSAGNLLSIDNRNFPIKSYRKGTGLFNFHSYRPSYEDPELGISLYGNNVLNTFASELYYRYNQNENASTLGFRAAYGGLFPVLSMGAEHTFQRELETSSGTFFLRQSELQFGYSIPLDLTRGKTLKFFQAGSNFVFNATNPVGPSKNLIQPFHSTYLHHFLSWTQQLPRARQHIYPRLGYAASTAYRHRTDQRGYQFNAIGNVYLPSPARTHSLVFTGSYQLTDTANLLFSNRFSNARGYDDLYFSKMWKLGANYHFPLIYPDKGIANILYLLRIRGNVFYDHSRLFTKDRARTYDLRSVGGELTFDTKWWNSLPVSIGIRYSYLLDPQFAGGGSPHRFDLVLPLSLIPD